MTHIVKKLRLPALVTERDTRTALRDIEAYINKLMPYIPATDSPTPGSGIRFLVKDSAGEWFLYDVIAGAGITLTLNQPAKTLTITSP